MRRIPLPHPSFLLSKRRWFLIAMAVLGLLVLGYAIPAIALANEVPSGTRVAGVDIGGLSPTEAEAKLARELEDEASGPFEVDAAGTRLRLSPDKLGLSLDVRATVEAARDGSTTPAGVVRSLFGGRELQPQVKVDEQRLAAGIARLAKKIDRLPREGGIHYQGITPEAVLPRAGRTVDQAGAAQAVRQAYPARNGLIRLPVNQTAPKVPAEKVREIAASTARAAVATPLTLTNGSRKVTLSPRQLAAHLRFVRDDQAGLRPEFDPSELTADLEAKLIDEGRRPKEASFKIVGGAPRVIPSRSGTGVNAAALGRAISSALDDGASRIVGLPATDVQPKLTTEQARKLGVKEKASSFTTKYPCCAPRVTNIHRIADIVDGYVVKPGETFSLNGVVGKRDKGRGFVEAPMILNNRFVNDVGGGVSQFATTMFNAVFFGGFQDVQHTPHQYYISRYPAGRESTVSYPQPDFRWRNDSPYGVLIKTSYTGTSITAQFWSTKRFEIESKSSQSYDVRAFPTVSESGPECIPMGGVEGFSIDVWRTFKKDGRTIREQKFHTVYDPEPRLVCT